jgi:hypothetical protein
MHACVCVCIILNWVIVRNYNVPHITCIYGMVGPASQGNAFCLPLFCKSKTREYVYRFVSVEYYYFSWSVYKVRLFYRLFVRTQLA